MKLASIGVYALFFAALVALGLLAAKPDASYRANSAGPPRPVLLELFTSEGCSSCPPADRLLESLDRTQPVSGAELIVLSEHVDYWNRLGWTDRFSSAVFTQRQQDYVFRLHLPGAYTPQLIIDGRADVVGGDERSARAAIVNAEARAKAPIALSLQRTGTDVKVNLSVDAGSVGSEVYVAIAEDHAESRVTRGENSGRTLRHVAIAKKLLLAGKINQHGSFSKELIFGLGTGGPAGSRVIVFLQDPYSKQVLGAAQGRI